MGSAGSGEMAYTRLGFVRTRGVIGEREGQHDGQPEDGADDDQLGALGAVTGVHEVENHERGFDGGNAQGEHNVHLAEVDKCRPNGDVSTQHQCAENE